MALLDLFDPRARAEFLEGSIADRNRIIRTHFLALSPLIYLAVLLLINFFVLK